MMPQVLTIERTSASSAEVALKMVETMRRAGKMDIQKKLDQLHELGVERIILDSPEQAFKIIAMLGNIISSNPSSEVRVAALEAMEHMIALEEKAELEHGKKAVYWLAVDLLLSHAKQETEMSGPEAPSPRDEGNAEITDEQTDVPAATSAVVAVRPQMAGVKAPAIESVAEPPIMKFLRSVAGTDSDESIRALANRVLARIENMTALKPSPPAAPAPTES
jgi:hypothetical protein